MLSEQEFRRKSESAIESLKEALIAAEDAAEIEVEEQGGVINILFENPPTKFVITPNSAVRQIWISALSTSFKLDWAEVRDDFVYEKTREGFKPLVARLINEQLGKSIVTFA
jgi:iron donor protein CyaY